jgi:flagella basal body P-ring formation protein FlgA
LNLESVIRYIVLYGLCLGVAFALLDHSEAETIRVNRLTSVSGKKDLYLVDLIDTKSLSESVKSAIRNVKITNAPQVGERRVLSNRSLSKILRKHLGSLKKDSDLTFKIPSEVIIENTGDELSNSSVQKRLRSRWQGYCSDCRFEFDLLQLPKLNKGLDLASWQIGQVSGLPKGSFTYPLIVTSKTGEQSKYWLQGQARVLRNVPVAKRHLAFGQTLLAEDLKIAERDVTFAFDEPASMDEIQGQLIKRTLPAGHVIWQGSVQKPRAVRRGQPVRVILKEEGWSLSLQGVAQEAGRIGEDITVRNPKSNKLLSGRVVADGEVVVE